MEFDKVETIFDIDKNLLEKIDEFKNERIFFRKERNSKKSKA